MNLNVNNSQEFSKKDFKYVKNVQIRRLDYSNGENNDNAIDPAHDHDHDHDHHHGELTVDYS